MLTNAAGEVALLGAVARRSFQRYATYRTATVAGLFTAIETIVGVGRTSIWSRRTSDAAGLLPDAELQAQLADLDERHQHRAGYWRALMSRTGRRAPARWARTTLGWP